MSANSLAAVLNIDLVEISLDVSYRLSACDQEFVDYTSIKTF